MKNVYAAFIKAQADLKPVREDCYNPHFKSRFADISAILRAVIPTLSKHDLAISQTCRVLDSGTILQTRIIHVSGEEMLSEMILPFNPDPQKMGSLITYYKRYQLQAALGVATTEDDDDGNGASNKDYDSEKKKQEAITTLRLAIKNAGKDESKMLQHLSEHFKSTVTMSNITPDQYDYAMSFFEPKQGAR